MTPSGPPRAIPSGRLELFHQGSYSAAREPLRFKIPIGAPRRSNEHSPPDSDNSVRAFIPTPAAAPAEAPAAAYIDGARSATPTRRVYLDGGGGADVPPGEQGLGKPPEALAQDPTGAEGAGGAGGDRARRQLGRRGARGKLWLWVVGAPPEETALMAGPANVSSAPVTSTMAAAPTTSAAAAAAAAPRRVSTTAAAPTRPSSTAAPKTTRAGPGAASPSSSSSSAAAARTGQTALTGAVSAAAAAAAEATAKAAPTTSRAERPGHGWWAAATAGPPRPA